MFEEATRSKLRFSSTKGLLTVEDLWDLSLTSLNTLAKNLNKKLKESQEVDFLQERSAEDRKLKLSFDVVLHVLNTKKEEADKRKLANERRQQKQRILGILDRKKNESLEALSEEDLLKKLKELE
jgi:hypothetical protein